MALGFVAVVPVPMAERRRYSTFARIITDSDAARRSVSQCRIDMRKPISHLNSVGNDEDIDPSSFNDVVEVDATTWPTWPRNIHNRFSRRHWLIRTTVLSSSAFVPTAIGSSTKATAATTATIAAASAGGGSSVYVPAKRPTVYRVDSTVPPTLLAVPKYQDQKKLLRDLGRGLGTDKKEVFIDRINLNNMLQKIVYGTIDAVQSVASSSQQDSQRAPASFVCFGLPMEPTIRDMDLTTSLLQTMLEKRLTQSQQQRSPSAIGIATLPCTAQGIVDDLVANRISLKDLSDTNDAAIIQQLLPLYRPIFDHAIQNKIPIIAMGLSKDDEQAVQSRGIQGVNPTSRGQYNDRSLLKDRLLLLANKDTSKDSTISEGNYFAERILSHEAGATLVSQYAIDHNSPDDCCVIAIIAPINDVRYLGGINGRIPRIYQYLSNSKKNNQGSLDQAQPSLTATESVSMNDVTTILINPNAVDSLSRTVRLRLEIGTGPETIAYQTKIADYLWFSSSPPVNLLPRVMDY
jgi:Haem-binding uptake, Tiki superfamily, ChaN